MTPVEEPQIGITAEALDELGALPVDTDDLVEINLDDCDVCVLGFSYTEGGEEKETEGREWVTKDQLTMHLRIDDIPGIDDTMQFLTLPKMFTGDDGKLRRREVATTSKIGVLLAQFANCGVSGNEQLAVKFKFEGWGDLVGLRYHRQLLEFPSFRNQSIKVEVPTEIHGFDNEVRKEAGLAPAKLLDE